MTTHFFIRPGLVAWAILILAGCTKEGDCVDPDLKQEMEFIGCATVYDPVCGCDGNTYGNDCEATRAGIRESTPGPCAP